MNQKLSSIWGIHAGKTGDADSLFLTKGCIALGWDRMGDLSKLDKNRESFKAKVILVYPEKKPGAIPNTAGQLFRFVHELLVGDYVAYPSRADRKIHIGVVEGDYAYRPSQESGYPHLRKVKWLKSFPRAQFSQGALYEIGSAMSFFQIGNYTKEYREALVGKHASTAPLSDPTVKHVAKDIVDNTHDFVLKQLSQELKGFPLENFVKHLLECMGYQARLSRPNEPSVDIIAHKDFLGIEPPIIKIQVKSGDNVVTDRDVSALHGKLSPGEYGLFVTLGTYSAQCRNFEQSKPQLRLIDGEELVEMIFQHYEQFDARYKGVLPLRRVYVPEPIEESEE